MFGKRGHCDLSPPLYLPLSFLGVQLAHLLRRLLTIQNPKKSWLATKSACSLVDTASLGSRLPPSSSGCPCCLSLEGDGQACSRLALLSSLFCLLVSSVSDFHPDTKVAVVDTFLGSLVQLHCGEGGTLQTNNTGMCSQCLGHTGFAPAHGVCAFPVYTL